MSVAHGIAHPRLSAAGPMYVVSAMKISAGATIPPIAAASGDAA